MSDTKTAPAFEPPDVGPWELDASHFDAAFPRYGTELFVEGFTRGQAESFERVGVPMRTVRVELVNGFPYVQLVPLVGKASDAYRSPPPRWLFKLMQALHPTLRKRARAMEAWVAQKGWREDLRRWDEELRPDLLRRCAALEAVDLGALDDEALLAHVELCRAGALDDMLAHFFTNPATIMPVGSFLRRALEWTGARPVQVLAWLESGEDERATNESSMTAWVQAASAEPEAGRVLADTSTPPESRLARLRERDDALGEATRRWYADVAHRQVVTGDLSKPIGVEVPEVLVDQLRAALEGGGLKARVQAESLLSAAPQEHRAELEQSLHEARLVHRLRNERSLLDCATFGVLRRALLECGERLVKHGRLLTRQDVVDLSSEELAPLLREGAGPSAKEVSSRGRARRAQRIEDAPPLLGADRPPPPPPTHLFDGAMAELLGAITVYRELMERDAPVSAEPTAERLPGLAASGGRYTGTARICLSPEDFGAVRQGDVLIARTTMPAYDVLLPLVGAIVTDRGGALCHAAIVARECGIPCVVGTRVATTWIRSGDTITVDGDAGEVALRRVEPRVTRATP